MSMRVRHTSPMSKRMTPRSSASLARKGRRAGRPVRMQSSMQDSEFAFPLAGERSQTRSLHHTDAGEGRSGTINLYAEEGRTTWH